jgi:hypothetical protein
LPVPKAQGIYISKYNVSHHSIVVVVSSEQNMEMCDDAQEMSCLASRHEDKGCDVKLASKAGQRINRSFEFQVQAISADKLPFILHAVVVFTAIAPIADGTPRYDDNLSRKSADDDVVRGVIERDTLALAASMAMEEIVRATTSSSINHHAVFEFENVQLELKQFGRLIVYDACIYVKPQSVDFSYGAGQAGKVLLTVVQYMSILLTDRQQSFFF